MTIRVCPICKKPLSEGWARPDQVYCSRRCKNRAYYLTHPTPWKRLYEKRVAAYKRSGAAEEGISLWRWQYLPKEWRNK